MSYQYRQEQTTSLPEKLEQIESMLKLNMTRQDIANKLGLTKNQVSGLIFRHLDQYTERKPLRRKSISLEKPPKVEKVKVEKPAPIPLVPLRIVEPISDVKADLSFDPPEGKFNIFNIKAAQCRWIDNEGFFCADPTGDVSKSYCEHHHKICFVPSIYQPKREKTWHNSLPKVSVNFA
jgi:hypothetical protein